MAYVDRQSGTSRATSIATVAVIHAGLGALLIYGLAAEYLLKPQDGPLVGVNVPLDPPDPTPTQKPTDDAKKPDSTITAPDTKINVQTQDTVKVPDTIDYPPLPPTPTAGSDKVAIYIPPTPPRFTPKPPRPANDLSRWVTTDDYPVGDIRREHTGTTRYRVVIGTNGRVTGCEVVKSSGWSGLDEATCNYVSKRAKFEPGTDSSGAKAVDTYTGSVVWRIPK